MTEEIRKRMEDQGMDVAGALGRMMGNEALFVRIMKKFLDDQSFGKLKDALAQKDYDAAFEGAHALKGVAGNLGLNPVMEADIVILEKLRRKETEGLEADFEKLNMLYEETCEILKEL